MGKRHPRVLIAIVWIYFSFLNDFKLLRDDFRDYSCFLMFLGNIQGYTQDRYFYKKLKMLKGYLPRVRLDWHCRNSSWKFVFDGFRMVVMWQWFSMLIIQNLQRTDAVINVPLQYLLGYQEFFSQRSLIVPFLYSKYNGTIMHA